MTNLTACGRRLKWADGEYDFDLGSDRALKLLAGDPGAMPAAFLARGYFGHAPLQGQFGDTPAACLKRFEQAVYSVSDVERILEISLYGGGMASSDAAALVDKHVRGKPLAPNAVIALEVLSLLFVGSSTDVRAQS